MVHLHPRHEPCSTRLSLQPQASIEERGLAGLRILRVFSSLLILAIRNVHRDDICSAGPSPTRYRRDALHMIFIRGTSAP